MRGRLRAIRARGGKVVVVDPRRTRTAEVADEHHFIRPGTDARCCSRSCTCSSRRGSRGPGRLAELRDGLDAVEPLARDVHARGGRARRPGSRADDDPPAWRASWRPPSAPPSTAASAPRRRSSARSPPGSSTCSTCSPATSTAPGGAMFPRAAAGAAQHAGRAGPRARRADRALALARARPAGEPRRAAGRLPGRGDRDARRGPGPRADHARRQPGALDAELGPARARRSRRSTSGRVRPLPQRDDAPRRRDPAARRRRSQRSHYDLAFYQLVGAQRRELLAAPCSRPSPAQPDEWETLLRLAGVVAGQGAGRRRRRARPHGGARACAAARDAPLAGRDARSCWPSSSRGVGPERLLDVMLRAGPYGTLDARRDLEARARTASTSARSSRACPRCCARRAAKVELAPRGDRRRRRAPARRAGAPRATAAWCSSAAASCAPTTPGCTTSTLLVQRQGALHAARPPRRRRAARPRRRRAARA